LSPAGLRTFETRRAAVSSEGGEKLRSVTPIGYTTTSMGGRLAVYVDGGDASPTLAATLAAIHAAAHAATRRAASRIDRWATRLTRHDDGSELSRLNADPRETVPVGPTLGAVLIASRVAMEAGAGFVDVTLLGARLAAETGGPAPLPLRRTWSVAGAGRAAHVIRPAGLAFDLGGVGKGWIADRAVGLLTRFPGALVDADGDLALRSAAGSVWEIGIDDPRSTDGHLALLRLGTAAGAAWPRSWGVATSGTSVHRWRIDGELRHHLIDPRTGGPARTDVVQATVVADSALRAEAYAKAAVIAGSVAGFALLDRAPVRGAVLLLDTDQVLALPRTLALLAA
jgi:thiamine biosynthesis lipoprotein